MNITTTMIQLRSVVKLSFGLTTLWLALIWAKFLPRPGFLSPEMEIEPLTVVLGTTAVLLFGFWKNAPAATASVNSSFEPSLQDELIANFKAKYQKRIDSKLAGRFPVNLRINASHTGTSEETAQNFITLQDEQVGHEIGEIFDLSHGRLLVVGLPGAGKTTLLLQLAVELLKRAEAVPATLVAGNPAAKAADRATCPIPVLLNLATWRSEFATFDEWLKRILPNELGASKALAEKIRLKIPLILLLDGLDEMPEQDRNSCLEALGHFGMKPENQFAISSRINEYAATKDAPVYSQVEVAPLTADQIEMNLIAYAGLTPEAKPLLNAIQKDPFLKQAIENPFYLNTAQLLFASGKKWSEFGFVATDVVGRQEELVERFVGYALGNKVRRDYPAEKAKKWLGFLAGKMEENKLRVFELSNLQPAWSKKAWLFGLVNDTVTAIILILLFGLFILLVPPASWSIMDLLLFIIYSIAISPLLVTISSLGASLFYTFFTFLLALFSNSFIVTGNLIITIWNFVMASRVKKAPYWKLWNTWNYFNEKKVLLFNEDESWSWINFTKNWDKKFKKNDFILNIGVGYILGMFFATIVLLILWVIDIDLVVSGETITLDLVIVCVITGSILGLLISISNWMDDAGLKIENSLQLSSPYHRFKKVLKNHGRLVLKSHIALRITLSLQSSLPLRLVHFLNEMSRRHLLEFDGDLDTETGGGSWRWRHWIIQEYFLNRRHRIIQEYFLKDEK